MKTENNTLRSSNNTLNIISDDYSHDVDLEKIQGKYSPASVFSITIIGIAMAEVIAMVVVYFQRQLPYYQQVLIDATVMTVIIFPLLYFLSFRPLLLHVRQRYQVERILKSRLQIVQFADTHSLDELLKFTVDKLELLTESAVGYFHFVESDQRSISLQTWSTNTIQKMCDANLDESHYSLDDAGVWADCIRQRRVVVHNDYATLPHGKGLPDGHAPLIREMAIPIIRDEKIVAVFGVGNKPSNYNETDVDIVSTLADFSWDIINQKVSADTQRESEEKFRTLADWTYDWELWLDPYGQIIYNSLSSERITGYNVNEFAAEPDLLLGIVHPDDQEFCMEHHELIHDEKAGIEKVEYRIIDRGGSEHWIEHICRPVFGADNHYLGRRISNRDITQRKRAESELRERNKQERVLTQTIHTMQLDIARDLHDTIGQNIGYLRMKLEHLAGNKSIKKADMQSEMQVMTMAANESYDLIRGTLAILQSGESSDLFRVFSRYAEQIEERSSIQVDFSINGDPRGLSAKRMRQLFYIFREALTNIEKHAQASQVSIRIDWDNDCLSLAISDNGEGFDPLNIQYGSHYGLKFMRERVELLNGLLDVQSTIGSGTKLVVQVPYE